jgi:hypothetical protein
VLRHQLTALDVMAPFAFLALVLTVSVWMIKTRKPLLTGAKL